MKIKLHTADTVYWAILLVVLKFRNSISVSVLTLSLLHISADDVGMDGGSARGFSVGVAHDDVSCWQTELSRRIWGKETIVLQVSRAILR